MLNPIKIHYLFQQLSVLNSKIVSNMLKYLNYKLAIEKGKKESISCWAWPWHGVCRSTHFSPQRFMPQSHPWLRPFSVEGNYNPRLLNSKLLASVIEFQIDIWFQTRIMDKGGIFSFIWWQNYRQDFFQLSNKQPVSLLWNQDYV